MGREPMWQVEARKGAQCDVLLMVAVGWKKVQVMIHPGVKHNVAAMCTLAPRASLRGLYSDVPFSDATKAMAKRAHHLNLSRGASFHSSHLRGKTMPSSHPEA